MYKQKAIVVLGMHRSGTSALTRVLNLYGATLPKRIMPPQPDNEAGFWEPEVIAAIHDELLASAGSPWDDVLSFPYSWFESDVAKTFRHRLVEALCEEYSDSTLFVIKDPRMCCLIPLWSSVLDEFGAEPLFVIIVRNPLEIAASLKVRNGFPQPKSMLLWLRHFLAAEKDTRGMKRTFVSYDDLLSDWRAIVQRLSADLSIHWPHQSYYVDAEVDVFISSQLRHHMAADVDIAERTDIVKGVKITFDWAVRAARGQAVTPEDLDAVSESLQSADLVFAPIVAMGKLKASKLSVDINRLNEEISQLTSAMNTLETQVAERDGRITGLQQEVQGREEELARFTRTVSSLETQVAERDGRITGLQQTVSSLETQVAEWDSQVASLQQEIQARQGATEDLVRDLEARLAEQDLHLKELYASTSWRVTAPMRVVKKILIGNFRFPYQWRVMLGKSARNIYRHLPFSNKQKRQLKSFIYRYFGFLIHNTATYRHWANSQQFLVEQGTSSGLGVSVSVDIPEHLDPTMLIRSSLPTNSQPDPLFADQSLSIAGHGNNALYNYDNAQIWYDNKKPVVSIIIVNFNNAEMTYRCLQAVWCYTCGHHYEVLVIDNGSVSHDYMQLQSLPGRFKLLRLSINRFFGEANNIGVEKSRGNFLVFLNNDAFVTEGWLEPLIQALTIKADAGGVGPKFIYPDGRLQEAGAFIRLDGKSDQLGRGGDPNLPLYNAEREVHYCSAATLALRRDVFYNALGFDLAWEPGYYEDSDLCLKIQTLGFKIYYCPFSTVVHLENKTTSSTKHNLKLHNVVDINRLKFLDRWQYLLKGDKQNVKPLIRSPFPPVPTFTNSKKIALYTSYEIIPGGGERYLLSMAEFLSQKFDVILLTPERYSRFRLLTIARELRLNLDRVSLAPLYAKQQTVPFDLFVLMGNELLPEFPGLGRKNIYHCQFPFPINSDQFSARIQNWSTYDQIIVNSNFTKNAIECGIRRFRLPRCHIEVVYPPVQVFLDEGCVPNKENIILSVGRIFSGGHNKRHDQMISAFRQLHDISGVKAELHFVGALHPSPEHRDHFLHSQALASDLSVYFHLNASPDDLEKLYSRALVYWHMTGFDVDSHQNPELCEHFGITVVEAMSAGCIPVVVGKGGPQETVTPGVSGFHFHRIDELVELTGKIFISKDELWVRQMQQEARNASLEFSKTVFTEHLSRILDQLEFSCE